MAARFWLGTTSTAWGTSANWSATSGGAGGAGVPTAADDVTFDGNGNNPCELNTSARVCLTFTVQAGYTNTITHTQQLTVSGNVTLHSSYTIAGSGLLVIGATATIVTGGKTWPNSVTLTNTTGQTYTLNDTFTISGTLTLGTGAAVTFAGTSGFNVATLLSSATQVQTITLKNSVTYTINTLFDAHTSRLGSIILFTSDDASLRANILMPNNGNNVCNVLADFRRIDASGGRSICTFGGTVTDCLNVVSYTDWKGNAFASSDGQ